MESKETSAVPPSMNREETNKPFFRNVRCENAALFLKNVMRTGKMGAGQAEISPQQKATFRAFLHTIPWTLLIVQLIWSSIVMVASYFLSRHLAPNSSSLGREFWRSHLNVSPTVSFAVGWALFVLLGLYMREAGQRYREGQVVVQNCGNLLRTVLRTIVQIYPSGTWHEGDMDRILAHAMAYPIALKMTLRADRSPDQLKSLLHPDDLNDVITADIMHVQCMRVIRSYISTAEDDSLDFNLSRVKDTPAGLAVRRNITKLVDSIDSTAEVALRISEFRPSIAYINHLHIFFYIWILFLPLALVRSSGWYVFFFFFPTLSFILFSVLSNTMEID